MSKINTKDVKELVNVESIKKTDKKVEGNWIYYNILTYYYILFYYNN